MCIYFTNVTISSSSRRSITFSSCLYISLFPFLEGSLGLQLKLFLIWEICICSCISCLIIMCKLHFFEFKKECHVLSVIEFDNILYERHVVGKNIKNWPQLWRYLRLGPGHWYSSWVLGTIIIVYIIMVKPIQEVISSLRQESHPILIFQRHRKQIVIQIDLFIHIIQLILNFWFVSTHFVWNQRSNLYVYIPLKVRLKVFMVAISKSIEYKS